MSDSSSAFAAVTEIDAGRRELRMSAIDLWIDYFGVGGNGSQTDVGRWLSSAARLPVRDHDLLAQALNDRFTDVGLNHPIGYSDTF